MERSTQTVQGELIASTRKRASAALVAFVCFAVCIDLMSPSAHAAGGGIYEFQRVRQDIWAAMISQSDCDLAIDPGSETLQAPSPSITTCAPPATQGSWDWFRRGVNNLHDIFEWDFAGTPNCNPSGYYGVFFGSYCAEGQREGTSTGSYAFPSDDCITDATDTLGCDGFDPITDRGVIVSWRYDETRGEYGYLVEGIALTPPGDSCSALGIPDQVTWVPAGFGGSGTVEFTSETSGTGTGGGFLTGPDSFLKNAFGRVEKLTLTVIAPDSMPCGLGSDADQRGETQTTDGEGDVDANELCEGAGGMASAGSGTGGEYPAEATSLGPNPVDDYPIDLAHGDKLESATDVVVKVTGPDFRLTRSYTSNPEYDAPKISGEAWTMNSFCFVEEITEASVDYLRIGGMSRSTIKVDISGAGPTWDVPGSTSQFVTKSEVTINGLHLDTQDPPQPLKIPAWRIVEPGSWEMDFYRVNSTSSPDETGTAYFQVASGGTYEGLMVQKRDVYGNTQTCTYVLFDDGSNPDIARMSQIRINGELDEDVAEADVRFFWEWDSGLPEQGRLREVQVVRFIGESDTFYEQQTTQRVMYTYMDDDDTSISDDLGTGDDTNYTPDLVQVVRQIRVDPDPGAYDPATLTQPEDDGPSEWRTFITQYRYHGNAGASTGVSGRYTWAGSDHQLKMVLLPEQIEYAAQKYNEANPTATKALEEFGDFLLEKDDDTIIFTDGGEDFLLVDLASKVIEEYEATGEKRVETQYILAACGCGGGGTQGKKREYTYFDRDSDAEVAETVKVVEKQNDGTGTFTAYRTHCYEMVRPGGSGTPVYLGTHAIQDDTGGVSASTEWVTHYKYSSDTRNLLAKYTPSAISNYVPGDGTNPPTVTLNSSTGLVHVYEYTDDNRIAKIQISEGEPTINGQDECTDCTLIKEITYGDSTTTNDNRKYLPEKIERYRIAGTTTGADNIETVEYDYGFHTSGGGDIAWIKTKEEQETVAENGPGGTTYDSYDLFNSKGYNIASIAADGTITERAYDTQVVEDSTSLVHSRTGEVVTITRNAENTLASPFEAEPNDLTTSGFGRHTASVSNGGSLTTQIVRDALGRVQLTKTPGEVDTHIRREMRSFPGRSDLDYYCEVMLPHELDAGNEYNGPATITWYNAGNDVIGTSAYTLGSTGYDTYSDQQYEYPVFVIDYELDGDEGTETGQLERLEIAQDLSGLVTSQTVWHRIADDEKYETTYAYDGLGRLEEVTNPNDSVTEYHYDVLDRVIKVDVGTTSSTSLVTVSETIYDSDLGSSPTTQGVGNGNVTLSRLHTGVEEASVEIVRDYKYTYDFRDRLLRTENPLAPHSFIAYDNLDRIVKSAIYKDVPDVSGTPALEHQTAAAADTNRGTFTETDYSQRGLPVREKIAISPTLAEGSMEFLETNSWYDDVGRTIGSWGPNGPSFKTTYDALSRPVTMYVTDRRGDALPGQSGNHAAVYDTTNQVANVTGDVVLEQTEYSYIEDDASAHVGMLELVTYLQRSHTAADTTTGALTSGSNAVATYSASLYDDADRVVRALEFGTDDSGDEFVGGTTAPTITQDPNPLPEPDSTSSDELVAKVVYDERGLVETSEDPDEQITKFQYDDMNRQTAVIGNYDADASTLVAISWSATEGRWSVTAGLDSDDADRVTSFVYDGISNVTKRVAHLPPAGAGTEDVQVTQYVYGVQEGTGTTDSKIDFNDLLFQTRYPKETDGAPAGATDTDFIVTHAYNALAEPIYFKDQNGSVHEYERDLLGRVEVDYASFTIFEIDDSINAITNSYDNLGRLEFVRSYEDYSGGSEAVRNALQFTYSPLWQIKRVIQEPFGDIDPVNSLKVVYAYSDADLDDGNYSRKTSIEYPDGTTDSFIYESFGYAGVTAATDDRISRMRHIFDGSDPYVHYDYIGLGSVAIVDYTIPDVRLTRYAAHNGLRTNGEYPGFDKFGRVQRHMWVDGDFDVHATDTSVGDRPPIVELFYDYDNASNRKIAYDDRPGNEWPHSQELTYDGLHRLSQADRGLYDNLANPATFTAGANSQIWDLDILGNSEFVKTDLDGDGNPDEAGEVDDRSDDGSTNFANEIIDRETTGDTTVDIDYSWDDNGNQRIIDKDPSGATTKQFIYTHDAWNRLVRIEFDNGAQDPHVIAEYEHNGLNWCVIKRADSEPVGNTFQLDQERIRYYDADWQLRAERIDDESPFSGDPEAADIDRHMQYLWGLRGANDIVLRRQSDDLTNDSPSTTFEDTWYHLTDVQKSTVAIIDDTGDLVERISYLPYGLARHHPAGDVDGDGDVDSADSLIISTIATGGNNSIGSSGNDHYRADADLNRDGQVLTASDRPGPTTAALISGRLTATDVDNLIGFHGHVFMVESFQYNARHRWYDPELARWLERDPAGYVDGSNLYEAMGSSPAVMQDPFGLDAYDDIVAEQTAIQKEIIELAKAGAISGKQASIMISIVGSKAQHGIAHEWFLREKAKYTAGTKAVVNASANTAAGFVTLGQHDGKWEPWTVSDQERAVGYGKSMFIGRLSTELGFGLATGSLSLAGKVGKAVAVWDTAGNAVAVGEAAGDIAECGLSTENALQLGLGTLGLTGNFAGALDAVPGTSKPQTTILGENMKDRVMPFADKTGARTLPWATTPETWGRLSPRQRWKLNDGALRARIREGDAFRYIGIDPARPAYLRQSFDLTRSELLRLQDRGVRFEIVSDDELLRVLGEIR